MCVLLIHKHMYRCLWRAAETIEPLELELEWIELPVGAGNWTSLQEKQVHLITEPTASPDPNVKYLKYIFFHFKFVYSECVIANEFTYVVELAYAQPCEILVSE